VGTGISLDVGGMELTYNKNHVGWDHGSLFQESDRKPIQDLNSEDPADFSHPLSDMGFLRPLKDVVPRLELTSATV
jgi:hypothetical protein